MGVLSRLAKPFALVASLSGCVAEPSASLSENPNGSSVRTQISNLPTDCTIVTTEQGRVNGRYVEYDLGTAKRTCVSSTNPKQRTAATDPLLVLRQQMRTVDQTARDAKKLLETLGLN